MKRIAAVLAASAALSPLAVSAAHAAEPSGQLIKPVNPLSELDAIATSGIPEEHRAEMPTAKNQLAGLSHLNDLNQLTQLTDLVAPVTNVLPAVG